ncbi:MAG: hypothetical protein EGR85_10935 [Subdoligranulum sp.]|nr:hypothetical protein [Subdoligranulum sp.]
MQHGFRYAGKIDNLVHGKSPSFFINQKLEIPNLYRVKKPPNGWEFLSLGANIDAAKEAARFGIGADRSVNYKCDEAGTALNYEVISEAFYGVPEELRHECRKRLTPELAAILRRWESALYNEKICGKI